MTIQRYTNTGYYTDVVPAGEGDLCQYDDVAKVEAELSAALKRIEAMKCCGNCWLYGGEDCPTDFDADTDSGIESCWEPTGKE